MRDIEKYWKDPEQSKREQDYNNDMKLDFYEMKLKEARNNFMKGYWKSKIKEIKRLKEKV